MSQRFEALSLVREWFGFGCFQREVCLFAAEGMGIVSASTDNRHGHVEFDFFSIWQAMKAAPRMPKMAWMYHTHPPGCDRMSPEDANSVMGWVAGLGMPIEMVVISSPGGSRHYRCRKASGIEDFGFPADDDPDESLLSAVMLGMSHAEIGCVPGECEQVVEQLNRVVPASHWGFFEHVVPEGEP